MAGTVKTIGFDYEGFDKDTRGKLLSLAGEIRRSTKSHIERALEMGEAILNANALLCQAGCESKFGAWVKEECGISRKTAYNYMNSFTRFGGNCVSLTQFTAEAVYLLSDEKVPTEAVNECLKLAKKGVRISKDKAAEVVKAQAEPEPEEEDDDDNTVEAVSVVETTEPVTVVTVAPDKPGAEVTTQQQKITGGTSFNIAELTSESKDAFGNEISGDLALAFQLCEGFDAQRAKLTSIKTWLTQNEAHAGAKVLEGAAQRIRTDIDNADRELKFAKPYCVCVYCKNTLPKVANCEACKGRGWITEPIYKAAPKGMQREKAAS